VTWKSYVIVSAVPTLLATYLVANPPATTPPRTPAAGPRAAAPAAAPPVDIQEQATRLQMRVREEIEYQEPSRNPFRYVARRPAPRAPREADVVAGEAETTPPVPEPPSITVAGIVTTTVDGASRRKAVLMTGAGAVEVSEGDAVGAEYRVVRIEADAVELAAADGTRRRINLR
jgi:hypothetical protein